MEGYARALETLAEGNYEQATRELHQLCDRRPNVVLLEAAMAAALLFSGRNESARDILLKIEQSGDPLTGATLWNLACAQIRLGDWNGALRALKMCSETEYRSKPELWEALKALGADQILANQYHQVVRPVIPILPSLTHNLPQAVAECRIEVLRRILRPKKYLSRHIQNFCDSAKRARKSFGCAFCGP
jgi:thioredoxin-like negative regulator of GroEL